ncbi:MAG: cytochrome c oxidase subunit II [Chromatiaceae bacterium]|nr:cytochrome c oxidase subunit II [Gammaproteobacteria bacterium]MCP5307050.1 cytochrome c oxidase subunit II [Chromatiaceae bacterium]MCP5313290.1 cytochrome c oxidase subunit II [Chromatiaceae bacterium]
MNFAHLVPCCGSGRAAQDNEYLFGGTEKVTVKRKLARLLPAFLGATVVSAHADYALNMREGVTSTSQSVYDLHMTIFWVCCAIGVVVFGAMIYSIIYHRKAKGAVAAQFHESTTMEILWTIVPIVILVSMAIPATSTLLAMEDTGNADLTIKVTGIQWKWKYDYVDGDAAGVSFISSLHPKHNEARVLGSGVDVTQFGDQYLRDVDNPLVIPTGKKVRFLLTAADVIHSWWVPDLGWKKDAIPGFVNEAWTQVDEPGVYRGKCAELCGKDHGFMPIVVIAKAPEDYAKWVAEQKGAAAAAAASADREWTKDELIAKGEQVYNTNCAACHQQNGQGVPPAFPALAGSKIATGEAAAHIDIVMNGKAGTAMAAYRNILNDADIAAVISYERNSWGNSAGIVQPAAVKAAR